MEFNKAHMIGMIISVVILLSSFFFRGTKFSIFIVGIGVLIGSGPIVYSIITQARIQAEKESMFLEFARNLVESVKAGTPISKSILNVRNKYYGPLGVHVKKLANQIALGIPLNTALQTFSKDINNKSISRALVLIGQAERAGGNIGEILEAVAEAVTMSDKLKKEQKASIHTLVVQGYIIFFVFIIIVLVMQFKIIPMISGISDIGDTGASGIGFSLGGGGGGGPITPQEVANSFLYLLLIQGFFNGLTIGKLSEGSAKAGVKHSFALMLSSFLIATGANIIFG